MKKEYILVVIIGLFLLSSGIEAIVAPLSLRLPTPFHYMIAKYPTTYPMSTFLILIRAIGIFLTLPFFMSFIEGHYPAKGFTLLIIIGLFELYSLQDIKTGTSYIPLEWALSLSLAGLLLSIPALWYLFAGGLSWLHQSLGKGE